MQIELTPEQQEFVRRAIEQGRLRSADEAIRKAMELWVENERQHDELVAAIEEGEASFAAGGSIPITREAMRAMADDIKARGRLRTAKR